MKQMVNASCLLNKIRGDFWMDEPKFSYLFEKLDKTRPVVVTGWEHAAKRASWDKSDIDFWTNWTVEFGRELGFNTSIR